MRIKAIKGFAVPGGTYLYPGQQIDAQPEFAKQVIDAGLARLDIIDALPIGVEDFVILASGPSLTEEHVARVKAWRDGGGGKVIVVNTTWRIAPWADILYAADVQWWKREGEEARASFQGALWAADREGMPPYVRRIRVEVAVGLSIVRGTIVSGGNSGYQAIGLAYEMGARSIVLLGYDMRGDGNRMHWHGNHPGAMHSVSPFARWIPMFRPLARDLSAANVEVVNCTPGSSLHAFPQRDLTEVLGETQRRPPLLVHGMQGMGDNVHQRAIVRALMQRYDVWLETSWPSIYYDMPIHFVRPNTRLRTQARNAVREREVYESPPPRARSMTIRYSRDGLRMYGTILATMCEEAGLPRVIDFSMPALPQAWYDKAERLIGGWPDKPLLVYRPLVERTEWTGCANRNPDADAYAALLAAVRDRYFLVSVADLEPNVEWITSHPVRADVELHRGEATFDALAALFSRASLVWTAPGFAKLLAHAVGAPLVTVFGGFETPAIYEPHGLSIQPIRPCSCYSHTHRCSKRIDIPDALRRLTEYLDAADPGCRNAA